MKTIWFRRKRYGWGWYPVVWQGWVVIFAYVAFAIAASFFVGLDAHPERTSFFVGGMIIATIILLLICWKTGERPRWQWGEIEEKEKK